MCVCVCVYILNSDYIYSGRDDNTTYLFDSSRLLVDIDGTI